jgi:hypothetical protein
MTDDLTPPRAQDPADAALDTTDQELLGEVATMLDDLDPVPEDLVARVQFALALDAMYDEVAQMTRVRDDALAVRTDLADAVRTETLTFSAERLTAMVTISAAGPGLVRIDGWITPAGVRRVSLRMQGADRDVDSDESGRFVAADVREGFVQLVFHPAGADDEGLVVTPLFKL